MALEIIAIAVSVVAVGISLWTGKYNRRSAVAAEGSKVEAGRSADAAKDSARSAAEVARAEMSRDHEMFRPQVPRADGFTWEANNTMQGRSWLVYTFALPRGYRMEGRTWLKNGNRTEFVSNPSYQVTGGQLVKVYVEDLTVNDEKSNAERLELLFWPPLPDQGGEKWTCPCGANTDPNGEPHWVVPVTVVPPHRTAVVVMRA